MKKKQKQECIPVGCVPSAAVAVCWRGVSARGLVSQHALKRIPPPVDRMTDRCKNFILAAISLRTVTNWLRVALVLLAAATA